MKPGQIKIGDKITIENLGGLQRFSESYKPADDEFDVDFNESSRVFILTKVA